MKKTLYTLCVNDFAPKICAMTFPLLERYAKKIGAEFYVIKDRKFPDMPVVYEKFQIYDLMKERGDDWALYFDADALIHPDMWDITAMLHKGMTCSGHRSDFAPIRFKPDEYFLRDGRYIAKGNWMMIASDWCRDIWHPLDDLTLEQAVQNITPIAEEVTAGCQSSHLI